MVNNQLEQLALRYLNGKATVQESRKVLSWFKTGEGQKFLSKHLQQDFENIDSDRILFTKKINTAKILGSIYEAESPVVEKKNQVGLLLKMAASFLILALTLAGYWYSTQEDYITYTSSFGEKKTITLPDQSVVILNGNSSIRIEKNWSSNEQRDVWLQGEAFFNVTHTKSHTRFQVHTSTNFNVEVLGTEFNVNSRAERTKVVLERGRISLNIKEGGKLSKVMMTPGEFVEFDEKSSYLIKKPTNVELITSWKEDKMILDETTLGEIAVMLENTYGLKLVIEDASLMEQKITGSVPNKNVDLFLKGLAEILDLKISKADGFVYLNRATAN